MSVLAHSPTTIVFDFYLLPVIRWNTQKYTQSHIVVKTSAQ